MNDLFYNQCKQILEPLENHGWVFTYFNKHEILMRKKYQELDEIHINTNGQLIEFVMPIKNSQYSYFKKFYNDHDGLLFLKNYINYL
jgi:hypothetical protein